MDYITLELALRIPFLRGLSMSVRDQSQNGPPGPLGSMSVVELGLVLDSLPEIVASFDGEGRLRYLNAAGRLWLRIGDPELETAILSDVMSEPAAERLLREALPEAARTGRWQGTGEILPRTGDPLPVLQLLVSHPPEEGKPDRVHPRRHPPGRLASGSRDAHRDLARIPPRSEQSPGADPRLRRPRPGQDRELEPRPALPRPDSGGGRARP